MTQLSSETLLKITDRQLAVLKEELQQEHSLFITHNSHIVTDKLYIMIAYMWLGVLKDVTATVPISELTPLILADLLIEEYVQGIRSAIIKDITT